MTGLGLGEEPAFLRKYHRDQPVSVVEMGKVRRVGRLEGDKLYVTERDVIELALENNLDINVQRHNRLTRELDLDLGRAFYDPKGNFAFNWHRTKQPTSSVLEGGTSLSNILTSYNVGYIQPFRTGTSFEVNFVGSRNRTTNFFASLIPTIDTQFQILLKQNLFEGFMKADAEYDLEISRNNLKLSDEEFRGLLIQVVSQVQDQFWELEYSLKDIEVKQKSLELAETVHSQNQARLEVGSASRLEVIQTEAEVAARKEELIRSQFNYRRAQDQLVKLVTNFDDPRQFQGALVPEDPGPVVDGPLEVYSELVKSAEGLRPELRQADLAIANRQVELARSRDKLKPALQAVVGWEQFGLGGTRYVKDYSQGFFDAPIVDIIPGGLGDSLQQMFSADYYGYVLGFNFEVPLANTDAKARNAQAQIEVNRSEMTKDSARQTVGLEIRDALTQIEMNQARIEAAEATVRSARERLQGEQARFEVGIGTTRELIEAQRDLLVAASVLVRARTDLVKSHNLLDKAVGRTLERKNIVLADALAVNLRRVP